MFASLHTAQLTIRQVQKGGTLDRLAARLALAHAAWHQRRQLARLDDAALADIGVTREAASAEAHRPLWELPGAGPR